MSDQGNSTPDRRTALLHIVIAVAEGRPAPNEIRFRDDLNTVYVSFNSVADLNAWVEVLNLGLRREQPHPLYGDLEHWTTSDDSTEPWHGWDVHATARDPITDEQARSWVDSGKAARAAEYDRRQAEQSGEVQP